MTRIQGGFKIHGNGKGADPTRIVPIRLGSARCTSNEVGADSFGIASSVRGTRYPAKGELLAPGNTPNRWQALIPTGGGPRWSFHGTGEMGLISEKRSLMVVTGEFFPK